MMNDDPQELARQLSQEKDPQKRQKLREKLRKIKENEFREKANQSGFRW